MGIIYCQRTSMTIAIHLLMVTDVGGQQPRKGNGYSRHHTRYEVIPAAEGHGLTTLRAVGMASNDSSSTAGTPPALHQSPPPPPPPPPPSSLPPFIWASPRPDEYTDRAVLWGVSHFKPNVSSNFRSELVSSIRAVHLHVHAAIVIQTDGTINCTFFEQHLRTIPCQLLPTVDETVEEDTNRCIVRRQLLRPRYAYIAPVSKWQHGELVSTITDFFSFKSASQHRHRNGSGPIFRHYIYRNRAASSYGTALGFGTWYRYIAHRLLMPVGVRQALYLDADACVLGDVTPMFTANTSAPLIVARRENADVIERTRFRKRGVNFKVVKQLWGWQQGTAPGTTRSFNAGVLVMNLLPYCLQDVWGQMRFLAHYHATVERLFGPLDNSQEIGDNHAVETVTYNSSHYVGAEYNCRLAYEFHAPVAKNGADCRIRHMHESASWLGSARRKEKHSCEHYTNVGWSRVKVV